MVYVTVKQSPMYHQMTVEDLLFGDFKGSSLISTNTSNTRTYAVERVSDKFMSRLDVMGLIRKLKAFNASTESLRNQPRKDLYHSFSIPKRHGGLRRIDAPKPDLMNALRLLKTIFEQDFCALYHTSAFAYVHGRCTLDAIKRHQANESKWFAKLDLHDFFGSTTPEFVMKMFSMVFPFSEVMRYPQGRAALETALDLAFLNGGLPQGTPISPIITNVMMIPIDYQLTKQFRDFNGKKLIYTRYADDFTISSRTTFSVGDVERAVIDTLNKYDAKFTLNQSKTRYGSSSGRNWNLGLMLNKDNEITVGYKRKKQFQTMLFNYVMDRTNGTPWATEDIRTMYGLYSYYHMVEPSVIDAIVDHASKKLGTSIIDAIKHDLQ